MKIVSMSIELTKLKSAKTKTKKGTPCLMIPLDQPGIIQGSEDKGGRVYLNTTIGLFDEKNEYDQDAATWIAQSKEEREAKEDRTYIGNGRIVFDSGNRNPTVGQNENTESDQAVDNEEDDLPF